MVTSAVFKGRERERVRLQPPFHSLSHQAPVFGGSPNKVSLDLSLILSVPLPLFLDAVVPHLGPRQDKEIRSQTSSVNTRMVNAVYPSAGASNPRTISLIGEIQY